MINVQMSLYEFLYIFDGENKTERPKDRPTDQPTDKPTDRLGDKKVVLRITLVKNLQMEMNNPKSVFLLLVFYNRMNQFINNKYF